MAIEKKNKLKEIIKEYKGKGGIGGDKGKKGDTGSHSEEEENKKTGDAIEGEKTNVDEDDHKKNASGSAGKCGPGRFKNLMKK